MSDSHSMPSHMGWTINIQIVMKKCFQIVANFLLWIARKTNLTYNEVNIIAYYGLIPLSWCVMLDYIIHKPVFTIAFCRLMDSDIIKSKIV